MTDTSLPSQPSSVPAADPSYVDSYAPPAAVSPAANTTATPASEPTSVAPASSFTPAVASDPLAELEKALQEYEARQKELTDQKQAAVQKTAAVVKQDGGEDPLEELERVLDEYEAKYKQQAADEPVQTPEPPATAPAPVPPVPPVAPAAGEAIEEQNIFELLGVMDSQPAEKEAFLDELQEALWEDFLDKDVSLLVTAEQLKEIQDLRAHTQLPDNERQEKLIATVEALVPDIEEIMLEKALELKEDMMRERVTGMKEYYAARPDDMKIIQEAEAQMAAGRWQSAAKLLNGLSA